MKAKDLAEILLQHPDREVVLAGDGEGNFFSVCADHSTGAFVPEVLGRGIGFGEFQLEPQDLDDEKRKEGYTEEDVAGEGYLPCIVLWP